jgi:hypothetical protein
MRSGGAPKAAVTRANFSNAFFAAGSVGIMVSSRPSISSSNRGATSSM